ncbi:DUF4190 domain-containing protein [Gordonia desulfuricans]|uniref:DUF4190 domain-containing protein n=1 Tax=Gordonia desulfuricans TaxID=89051 RepID=A0A7K3LKB6_9ACTN|nr:DUF4190 domain-containing protein [Gordonia desulfuricans]NDK88695.1 DUF4190 domain-containing protein [Gordonia desulfuricans]
MSAPHDGPTGDPAEDPTRINPVPNDPGTPDLVKKPAPPAYGDASEFQPTQLGPNVVPPVPPVPPQSPLPPPSYGAQPETPNVYGTPPGYGTPPQGDPYAQGQYAQDPYAQYGTPGYGTPGYGAPGYGTPGFGAPGYGTPGYGAPVSPPNNSKATASMICGIAGVVFSVAGCCFALVFFVPMALGIVALVTGIKARTEIEASQGREGGSGMAMAGIITGAISVVLGVVALVYLIVGTGSYLVNL